MESAVNFSPFFSAESNLGLFQTLKAKRDSIKSAIKYSGTHPTSVRIGHDNER